LEIVCGETHRGFKSHLLRAYGGTVISRGGVGPDGLTDRAAMSLAMDQARAAAAAGEAPVGAVAVADGIVLAARHNEREAREDPTAHAEMLVLQDAASARRQWRLDGVTVVVTLEPCPMCAGALVAARVARLVFGAPDPKAGACGSLYNLCADPRLNHELPVTGGVMAEQSGDLLTAFFAARRRVGAPSDTT
jgi:tRNA(adenine34) deaminase